ncbi:tRNA1(Val) (adenine(37)-N6)-methyltransferase [Lacicoccus qingdaonensis]|uniref:tRNA1(Val) (adenine(37)-N6)-methyltransferase n=1 Tax=Lacicoccus qingdaonensis TaxID=576118 RepID=UPI001FDF1984|nr:tRNA1(Val) (adenine(37)-N6)-methyltransferase [Salinicoccus qingdaonensis]
MSTEVKELLKDGERLDELFRESMQIIQSRSVFSFSVDALLLADFTKITKRDKKIMDLCSGNGIIPLLLSHRTSLPIDAVEIQEVLVDMAERSFDLNEKSSMLTIHNIDIKNIKSHFEHSSYDVITVNPPYFTNDQPLKTLGPHSIARHEVMIDLEGIIAAARYLIKNKGRLYMVHRAERSEEVTYQLMQNGFRVKKKQFVYNDPASRTAMFVVLEAAFHSQAYVDILQPFYIYGPDNKYSKAMLEVYYG